MPVLEMPGVVCLKSRGASLRGEDRSLTVSDNQLAALTTTYSEPGPEGTP